jgi:hypothetical protein
MARSAFYSFHYIPDNWRASQVRNMGVVSGNAACSDNDWEEITKGGDAKIKEWIDDQLYGKSVAVILIGTETAGRKWINHEISTAWNKDKGVLGVHVHQLKNSSGSSSYKGGNPFDHVTFTGTGKALSSVVKTYDPPHSDSKDAYNYIHDNLADWIENAIKIRNDN